VNRTDPKAFRAFVESELELEAYLKWMAIDAVISNHIVQDSRSFLIFDKATRKWSYAPWDLNNAISLYDRTHLNGVNQGVESRASRPLFGFSAYDPVAYGSSYLARKQMYPDMKPAWSVLNTRILDDQVLRGRYLETLKQLLETEFRPEVICPRAQKTAQLLLSRQQQETQIYHLGRARDGSYQSFPHVDAAFIAPSSTSSSTTRAAEWLCRFVTQRRQNLLAQLEKIELHGRTELKLNRVALDGAGQVSVQIYNGSDVPQSLAGLFLSGNARVMDQSPAPSVTLPPHGTVVLTENDPDPLYRLDAQVDKSRPELALFGPDQATLIDLIYVPKLSTGAAIFRTPEGSEDFTWEHPPQ
jgi:spore coat protein H